MTPFQTLILVKQWVVIFLQNVGKFNINFAKMSQNRGTFLIFGKYMGPTFGKCMGQFSFSQRHIPTKKILSTPPGPFWYPHINCILALPAPFHAYKQPTICPYHLGRHGNDLCRSCALYPSPHLCRIVSRSANADVVCKFALCHVCVIQNAQLDTWSVEYNANSVIDRCG